MFSTSSLGTDLVTVDCATTFSGRYQFSYEISEGMGGVCNTTDNTIMACLEPGSAYVDNQVFMMNYGKCDDAASITPYTKCKFYS